MQDIQACYTLDTEKVIEDQDIDPGPVKFLAGHAGGERVIFFQLHTGEEFAEIDKEKFPKIGVIIENQYSFQCTFIGHPGNPYFVVPG
jgi:hypothetical protein